MTAWTESRVPVATVGIAMQIQPADFGANLNSWFRLLGRQWKPLLILSLVGFVPAAAVITILFFVAGAPGLMERLFDPELLEQMTSDELIEAIAPILVVGGIGLVLQVVASAFVYLGAGRVAAHHYAGVETDWRAASRFAAGRFWKAIGAGLLVTLGALITMGLVAALGWAVISGLGVSFVSVFLVAVLALTTITGLIWLNVSVTLYSQSIAMSDIGVLDSLKESFSLVQQRWWVSVGFLLVTGLIASAAAQVLSVALVPLYIVGILVPGALAAFYGLIVLAQAPVAAAVGAAYSVWYIDLRARRGTVIAEDLIR